MGRYVFIRFPNSGPMVRRAARENACHDRKVAGMWFGMLEIELLAEQPVHVGSGFKGEEGGKVVRRTARDGLSLLIPGSTMKGVIRSRFEAMTRSCAGDIPSDRGRIISQSHPEVQRGHFTPEVKHMPVFADTCGRDDYVCPACAMFGFQSMNGTLRSRVSVTDFVSVEPTAPVIESMPSQFEPRLHHLGDFKIEHDGREPSFEVGPLHGRKFYVGPSVTPDAVGYERVEAIPKGVKVRGTLRILNLDDAEMGGLLAALGVSPSSRMKVGCGKRHGFGRMKVTNVEYSLSDNRRGPRDANVEAWAKAFVSSPDRWEEGANKLHEIHQEAC